MHKITKLFLILFTILMFTTFTTATENDYSNIGGPFGNFNLAHNDSVSGSFTKFTETPDDVDVSTATISNPLLWKYHLP